LAVIPPVAEPVSAVPQSLPGAVPIAVPEKVNPPAVHVPLPTADEPPPAAVPPLQPVSVTPAEPVRPYVQPSLAAMGPRYGTDSAEMRMRRETAPWVLDLTRAVRPSVRMDAATALAEGRYGWHDEVKGYLLNAAANDPAGVVRAHCISLLTQLGYATTEYRTFLASCAADRNPDVRVAASIGLAKIEPR
jgi:hypothetical protein